MQDEVMLLFRELADLSPAEREGYFAQHAVDPGIRVEVESLLAHDAPTGTYLGGCVAHEAEDLLASSDGQRQGSRCGPYLLVRLLGSGGAGAVFLARRADGQVEQQVAVKLLRPDVSQRVFHARFLQERQILASLNHPGIARMLDAGQTEEGRPYLVMDYIDGTTIDAHAAKLDLKGKLTLFLQVCDAVSYAHRNLIVHRDIKPSNILVDAAGNPKLMDFGLAKILDAATDRTRTLERVLTPDYASPEQVRGAPPTTATDVYSLGAVLYDLLTGRSPHEFASRTPEAIDATICGVDPAPPSESNPELPADLDFIVRKALRKEPEERYVSVEAMAEDVRAVLDWRPVRARSGDAWYRARKFVRRYRTLVTAATLIVAALATGLYVANRERVIAQQRFQQLHQLSRKVFDLDRDISGIPGTTEARHNLVSTSLAYLEGLSAGAHGDLDLAQELADAYLRVARIQGVPTTLNLGEFAKAEENLKKADAYADQVLASRPRSIAALVLSAGIAHDRMILADSGRRKGDATALAGKALERLDASYRVGGLTGDQRDDAARYYANIALYHVNVHRYEDAVRYARRSIEVSGNLPSAQGMRASNLSLIGNSRRAQGRLDEALQALREARQIAEGPVFPSPTARALNLYSILLRLARLLGQDGGISLGRPDEAIPVYQEAVDLTEEAASKDPRDQTSRDRLATCARELADLLSDRDPQRSLALFDLAIARLRETRNNLTARRHEAFTMAESSYPLRRLRRFPEARQRIESAFDLLRAAKDYPAETLQPESEVVAAVRAQADFESEVGDRRRAVALYEQLFSSMMASKPDPSGDLLDATKVSMMYYYMAGAYRRAGDAVKASEMDSRRLELWRQWDLKLPDNAFVRRQLTVQSQ